MSKAIMGAAELAGAAGLGAAMFLSGGALANPFTLELMRSLVMGGISMEAGAIADALVHNRGMAITTRQPAAFRQVIYGEQRVGGVLVYESTTGSKHDQYNKVIVIAGHPCESIVNLYLDGRQVFWTGSGVGNTTRNGVNFGGNADSADHIGPGGQHYNFGGLVYCEARYGDQQAGDVIGGLTANDPNWSTGANGSPYLGGCTYVYLKIEYNPAMFPQEPEIKFTVRGKNNIFDPRLTAPPAASVLQHPTTLLNGWGNNTHVGAYEEGQDQGYNWGLNKDTTYAYTSPDSACDGDLTTSASCTFTHTHKYAGCVWSFSALTPTPSSLYLNINSEVRAINGAARSAGIWYSLDGGTTWNIVYNQSFRQQQWDSIALSPSQDCSKVQVMAFLDSHDDMDHYVYEIELSTGPRSNTSQNNYTTNWALIVADVLTDTQFGLADTGSVNEDQLIAAANVCDEQVALAAGGTESRYACHYHFDCGSSPGDVLQTMMPAAMGRLSRIGGEWYIFPAYWTGPSFTFTQSDLTGKVSWQPYRKMRDLFNRVTGTYVAPNYPYNVAGDLYDTNGWYDGTIQNNFPFAFQTTSYPMYAADILHGYGEDVFLSQDNNIFLPKEITQQCVLSVSQAQRCAKIALMRNRQQGTGTLPMHLWAWKAQTLDVMQMTFSPYGWSGKQLEITSTRFMVDKSDSEHPVLRFQVGVQETDQTVYEWSTGEELSVYDVPSNPTQGSPYTVSPPTGLTCTSSNTTALTQPDGTVVPRIYASWTAPLDVRVTQIQIQYQASGASDWTDDGAVDVGTTSTYISGIVAGQSYNVRIRSLTSSGGTSTWDEADGITATAPNSQTNTYSNNPAIDLSQPTSTSISMGAVAVTFGTATVNYAARTFTIPTPSSPTWYYVTIADPSQAGESGSPTLTATCQTSNALVGVQGNTYIGAIQAIPAGGGTQVLAGGWPAPQTFQVGS